MRHFLPGDVHRLKTINVIDSMTPEEVFAECKKAIDNKEWAILMFHFIEVPERGELNYSKSRLEGLIKLLAPYKDQVIPVDEIIKKYEKL